MCAVTVCYDCTVTALWLCAVTVLHRRRVLPHWRHQMWTCLKRFVVQYRRGGRTHMMDLMMVAFGGACLGGTYKAIDLGRYPSMSTMSGLVVG